MNRPKVAPEIKPIQIVRLLAEADHLSPENPQWQDALRAALVLKNICDRVGLEVEDVTTAAEKARQTVGASLSSITNELGTLLGKPALPIVYPANVPENEDDPMSK
jgi:hypothetical protein